MSETPRRESDQLPEEAPSEQVPDDGAPARHGSEDPGAPGEEGTGTGNPDAAGSDEPDEED